jgi:hypothetical protein
MMNVPFVAIGAIAIFSAFCIGIVFLFPPEPDLEIVQIMPPDTLPPPFYYNANDSFKKDVVIVVEHPDEKISIGTR